MRIRASLGRDLSVVNDEPTGGAGRTEETRVDDGLVLRVFCFRPAEAGSTFDASLRDEIVPEFERLPGLVEGFVGRRGPDEAGERTIVSIWESRDAMARALGEEPNIPRFLPEFASAVTDHRLEILPVGIAVRFVRSEPPRVLRVFRGRVADDLDTYVAEAREGAEEDGRSEHGPCVLYLGVDRPSRFVTVSAWPQWGSIEQSTGADVRHPVATRHPERLIEKAVDHYEIVAALRAELAASPGGVEA